MTKKHSVRCNKCGKFMKNWGFILNTIMYFTPKYKWCNECILNENAEKYLMNNLIYDSKNKRWAIVYNLNFSNVIASRVHKLFIKLNKSKLDKNKYWR